MSEHQCALGDRCCQGEGQSFWLEDPAKLFCDLSPIPKGSIKSGERLNSISRFIVYMSVVMYFSGYKYWSQFLILGLLFIILIYLITKQKTIEKENYAFLSNDMLNSDMNTLYDYAKQDPSYDNFTKYSDYLVKHPKDTYRGASEQILKARRMDFLPGDRDETVGITYYTPKSGVNPKTMIVPTIEPRIVDFEVWGKSSTAISGINEENMVDLTTSEIDQMNTSLNGIGDYSMGKPVYYQSRSEGSIMPQNRVGENPDIGHYGTEQVWYNNENRRDFNENVMPIYQNFYNKKNNVNNINTPQQEMKQQKVKEKFAFVDLKENDVVQQNFGKMAQPLVADQQFNKINRGIASPPQTTPVTDQLLSESPTYAYNEEYFNQPSNRMYLQDIQPKLYSYSVDQTPINANIGISYNPQRAPRVIDQVVNANNNRYPVMTRIDPQLIRDDGTPGQLSINPVRTEWSAKYSDFEAPAGSINFEDIYDPRFNSYGDPYRSYSDVNLGQVRYYYSDVDAYRQPNFLSRTNVDFVDYRNPQGQIWPYYNRTASIDDVRSHVENQTMTDELYHREDMMSQQMAKRNREMWQLRQAPIRRTANSSMSYGPT